MVDYKGCRASELSGGACFIWLVNVNTCWALQSIQYFQVRWECRYLFASTRCSYHTEFRFESTRRLVFTECRLCILYFSSLQGVYIILSVDQGLQGDLYLTECRWGIYKAKVFLRYRINKLREFMINMCIFIEIFRICNVNTVQGQSWQNPDLIDIILDSRW